MTDKPDDVAALNTDRELYREPPGDYYADSLHVTAQGGIGINCGGYVRVMPLRKWYDRAVIDQHRDREAKRFRWLCRHAVFIDLGEGRIWSPGGEYGELHDMIDEDLREADSDAEDCEHEWISVINPIIKNGSMCTKCGKLKR